MAYYLSNEVPRNVLLHFLTLHFYDLLKGDEKNVEKTSYPYKNKRGQF